MSYDNRNLSPVGVGGENFIFDEDRNDLFSNVGRLITVFTESGGASGNGFTGMLIEANCRYIKLITSLPSAPRNPFGIGVEPFESRERGFCGGGRRDHQCRFGTVLIIPVRQIVCYVFNQI